jgi:beta-lactamase class D
MRRVSQITPAHRCAGWLLPLLLFAAPAPGQEPGRTPDLARHFRGLSGAFVLSTLEGDSTFRYNAAQCAARFSPASTFKIPNSLIGLETGVLHDQRTVIPWDSVTRPNTAWNRDHDLASAIRYSVVPYYQELARRVGIRRMQHWVDTLRYGNRDISGGIDRFWLGSTLTISADEQIEFLRKLVGGTLPVSKRSADIVREILLQDSPSGTRLRAKTGSATQRGGLAVGWYVGYVESKKGCHLFAMNIISPDAERDGEWIFQNRVPVARAILHELGVL